MTERDGCCRVHQQQCGPTTPITPVQSAALIKLLWECLLRYRKRSKFPSGVVGASQVTLSVWDASGGLWKRSVGLSS